MLKMKVVIILIIRVMNKVSELKLIIGVYSDFMKKSPLLIFLNSVELFKQFHLSLLYLSKTYKILYLETLLQITKEKKTL